MAATLVWRLRAARWAEHTTVDHRGKYVKVSEPFVRMAEAPPVTSCPAHIQTQV